MNGSFLKISIVTVFPELYKSFLDTSIIARARENNVVEYNIIPFSDVCDPKVRIDEPTVGPGSGMVIKPSVIAKAIDKAENHWGKGYKIFFSPQGKCLNQPYLQKLSKKFINQDTKCQDTKYRDTKYQEHLILICCRYEGQDERVFEYYADDIISIGDYVLMGGDLPAQLFLESFLRLIPKVVGNIESVEKDSFTGALLDYPQYGLPREWNGKQIPEVLLSGNHLDIEKWRILKSIKKTVKKRFDWFRSRRVSENERKIALENIPNHYVALMHGDVLVRVQTGTTKVGTVQTGTTKVGTVQTGTVKTGTVKTGTTSVTSLDIHDIARSSATYGVKNVFIVSPLIDQIKIVKEFLKFWLSDKGKTYNPTRFNAVKRVIPIDNLDDVISKIKELENLNSTGLDPTDLDPTGLDPTDLDPTDLDPIIIATSAKKMPGKVISYGDHAKVWDSNRPVLILFGTGQGLSNDVLERCDYLLEPILGLSDYNHLSVRSAAGIILDRWLGLNFKPRA